MLIEIIADITCPWCYIGMKRLVSALEMRPEYAPAFVWRPFLLNPDLQDGSIERYHYLTRVFGSESRIQQFQNAVDAAGEASGIPFDFEKVGFTPSSLNAHRMIAYAADHISPVILAERLFKAYFVDGEDIGSIDTLVHLGEELGLNRKNLRVFLESERGRQQVLDENVKIHRLGINGVPAFVFGKRNIMSGAQEPNALLNVLDFIAMSENLEEKQDREAVSQG